MGEVWAARNELTNRDFAIKFLLPEFNQNSEAFERFVREAKTTGTLQHPSIVDVYDVALGPEGRPFIVMELLHGEELEAYIERVGSLSPLQTAAYFAQIAAGLQIAHDAGVVHRDLSTNNIFLARGKDGETLPKVLDFGVSKTVGPRFDGESVTSDGAVLGNPIFMSPEQARGAREVDGRTDVWALGVGMYECLTGRAPFRNNNYNALMVDIMTHPHRPIRELLPALDRELADVVEGCLKKDREERLGSAKELAFRLGSIARRLATDPGELERTPRRRATDRLPDTTANERQSLEDAGLPLGVRFWHGLGLPIPSRGVVGLLAAAAGIALGIGIGTHIDRPAPVVIHTSPASVPDTKAVAQLAPAAPEAAPASGSPSVDTNLARAVTRQLAQKPTDTP
jgi:eukaryotic-like serine/threonine-protein kinase